MLFTLKRRRNRMKKEGNKMKSIFILACIGVVLLCTSTESDAQIRARLGLSSISGLVGVEYQADKIGVGVGWLPLVADNETKQTVTIGSRYYFQPFNSGLTLGLSYDTAAKGAVDYNGKIIKTWPAVNVTGGYRIVFGRESIDLTLGAGYGVILGGGGKVALDLTLGFAFL